MAPTIPPPQRQGSLSDPNQRLCFICLQNDKETPDSSWVTPCPCTLEAHEECMLRWVAETESSAANARKKLRCPACKHPIQVIEPYDSVVKFRERFNKIYSRTSPFVLLAMVSAMSLAGSSSYGLA